MDKKYNHNTHNKEQIELRSDNTRHFINEEPPFIIRYGTMAIILLLLILASVGYFAFLEYH